MAVFRSSLLTVKAGDSDVGIGPSTVLSIILAASDRSTDRLLAAERASRVKQIMTGVSYENAKDQLPRVAVSLMQNLNPADRAGLASALETLKAENLPTTAKCLLLGLKLTDVVSTEVLLAAKDSLGQEILLPVDAQPSAPLSVVTDTPASGSASAGLPQTPQTPDRGESAPAA